MSTRKVDRIARAALAFALVLGASQVAAAGERRDARVTRKVAVALRAVTSDDVTISTLDGRVTLRGSVGSTAERVAAATLARRVDGVREVRNLLEVETAPRARAAEPSRARDHPT